MVDVFSWVGVSLTRHGSTRRYLHTPHTADCISRAPRVFCGQWRRPRKKTVLHYLCSSAKKFAGNDSRLQRENIRFNPLRGFDALLERGDQRHAHAVLSRVDAVGGA